MPSSSPAKFNERTNSYIQIFKGFSIFGGIQALNIIVSIIKTKIIAVFLGTVGIGLYGLINSTISLIISISSFGLNYSSVRAISITRSNHSDNQLKQTISVVMLSMVLSGSIGMIFTLVFAKNLSSLVFGNLEYSWAFQILSIAVILQIINIGQFSIFQGMGQLKFLAKSNIITASAGLLLSSILIITLGMMGLILSFVIIPLFSIAVASFIAKRSVPFKPIRLTLNFAFKEAMKIIKQGGVIMITNIQLTIVLYLIQIYINKNGGTINLGLYIAATTFMNSYISLIFSAMLTDYLPRLSATNFDVREMKKLVIQQIEITLLILGPILIFLMVFISPIVQILYTDKFISIIYILLPAIPGVFLMAINWAGGIMLIAKGDFKSFFILELLSDAFILFVFIYYYNLWGLVGVGYAMLSNHIFRFVIQTLVLKMKYEFFYNKQILYILFVQIILSLFVLLFKSVNLYAYLTGTLIFILAVYFAYFEAKKRIQLSEALSVIKKHFNLNN